MTSLILYAKLPCEYNVLTVESKIIPFQYVAHDTRNSLDVNRHDLYINYLYIAMERVLLGAFLCLDLFSDQFYSKVSATKRTQGVSMSVMLN